MNPLNGADAGYLNFLHDTLSRDSMQLENETRALSIKKAKMQMAARNLAGSTLMNGPQIPQPPQPGQSSTPAAPPAQAQAPAMLPGAGGPSGGAPVQPYLSYDDHVAKAGDTPALPAAPTTMAAATPAPPKRENVALATGPLSVGSIIKTLKQNNVADDMVMGVLDELLPVMSAENKVEYQAVKAQLDVARESHRYEIAQIKNDIAEADLERKKERDRNQDARGRERLTILRDRISAENSRTQLMIRQYERLAKNDGQKQSVEKLKALNAELGRWMQEIPGLESAVVNGVDDVKNNAATRLEQVRLGVDMLQKRLETETAAFLDATDIGDSAPGSPMMRHRKAAGKSDGSKEKPRTPMPTDPAYDYQWDGSQWLRAKKQ